MEPLEEYRQQRRLASPETQAALLSDAMRRSTDMNSVVKSVLSRQGKRRRKQANQAAIFGAAGMPGLSRGLGLPSGETLSNMSNNAGRFIRGGTSALAAGLGHVATGYNAAHPAVQGNPNSLFNTTGDLARAGVNDMWSSMTGADPNQPWEVNQVFDRVRSAPGVTPGVARASNVLQRGGELAATAAMGTGAAGLARGIPGVASSSLGGLVGAVSQPLTATGIASNAGRAGAEIAKSLPTTMAAGSAMDYLTEPMAGANDAQQFMEGQAPQQESVTSPPMLPNGQPAPQQAGGTPSPTPPGPGAAAAPQTGSPSAIAPHTPASPGLPAEPSQVTDAHILASDDQSLTQYIEQLPPEQQGDLVQRAFTAKVKDNLAKQNIPPEQQAARLQELTAKAEQGGWTTDDLQMAAESAAQSIDPTGQMSQKPGFFEQIIQGVQQMSGWQIGALLAGAGLGLVGLMHGLGGGGLFSSLMMTLLGAGAAAYGSGALDSHLGPLGLPSLRSLTAGLPGGQLQPFAPQQGPAAPPGLSARPDFPQLGGQEQAGAADAASWMQPYMGGGSDPNALDAGDIPAIANDWQSGQLQDQQIQQMIGSIPQQQRGQMRSQLDRLSWVPRSMRPQAMSSAGLPPTTIEALQQLTPQQYRQLQQWLAP